MIVLQSKNFLGLFVSKVQIKYVLKTHCPIYRTLGQRVYHYCTVATTHDASEYLPRARLQGNMMDVSRHTFVSLKSSICRDDWMNNK